jgi:para-nitrobenzyl esterase
LWLKHGSVSSNTDKLMVLAMALRTMVYFSAVASGQGYTVDVPGLGSLNGTLARYTDVAAFLGIPYAKPPLGALRWQPPQAYGAWQSPRDATKFGHACIQAPGLARPPFSEDCLFLNIATPVKQLSAQEKLHVMFWIHGGAYTQGEAASYAIDALVSQSGQRVVVAATNYRLGYLGFAASAEIKARSADGSAGNFGLQDQRLAMMWVRDHIGAFGGDGSKMTVFGESAGGSSIMNHLALSRSEGLFQRAIVQSGTYMSGAQPLADAQKDFGKLLKTASCSDLDCLLAANATVVTFHDIEYWPAIDGVEFNASAGELIQSGMYQKEVDVLLGSNRDEFALFAGMFIPDNVGALEFNALLEVLVPNPFLHPTVKKIYEANGDYKYPADLANRSQDWWEIVRIATDGTGLGVFSNGDKGAYALGHCGARSLARSLKSGGTSKVFQYLFAGGTAKVIKHGDEIGYSFGDVKQLSTDIDKKLAIAMAKYWSNFAVTGDPNSDGLSVWPEYDAKADKSLRLDETISVQEKFRSAPCDFWDAHPVHVDPNSLPFIGASYSQVASTASRTKGDVSAASVIV